MRTEKRTDGWWIVDVSPYNVDGQTFTTYGPYKTKDEAESDRMGLVRFQANNPAYVSDAVPTSKDETPKARGTLQLGETMGVV